MPRRSRPRRYLYSTRERGHQGAGTITAVNHRSLARIVGVLTAWALVAAFPALANAESVEMATSPGATLEVPMTITVSGTASGSDKLFVFVDDAGRECTAEPDAGYGDYLTGTSGEALPAGAYNKEYSYTPPFEAFAPYSVCGYLDTGQTSLPSAKSEHKFEVARPSGSVSIKVAPNPVIQGNPVSIKVSGTTEVARKLFVYVDNLGRECTPEADTSYGAYPTGTAGESIAAGSYSKEYVYSPNFFGFPEGSYSLCGYIATEAFAIPEAAGDASLTVLSLAGIAEKEKQAAEARAQKEAAEAQAARAKYEEEKPAREAAEKATAEARENAEWVAAETRGHNAASTHLSVKVIARVGRTSQHPGRTELVFTTSAFAEITVRLTRYGRRTEHFEAYPDKLAERSAKGSVVVEWTCKRPGSRYAYVVTARTAVSPPVTRRGYFSPVTTARCEALKHAEQEARERSARRYAEEVARRAREERETLERFEENCRTLGGTPVTLYTSEGAERACRAPNGGRISVPY